MRITELRGKSHVFTLKDKSTLRILAYESVEVANGKISEEMKVAESMGLILMTKKSPKSQRLK